MNSTTSTKSNDSSNAKWAIFYFGILSSMMVILTLIPAATYEVIKYFS